jgi:hypothetical protein
VNALGKKFFPVCSRTMLVKSLRSMIKIVFEFLHDHVMKFLAKEPLAIVVYCVLAGLSKIHLLLTGKVSNVLHDIDHSL